ncbi:MAG TPA: hypothetical protein VFV41_28290 [Streptosporangiaceae bacterium]|nr:hypothetical protein [Streptosporangiaceae bacterium]
MTRAGPQAGPPRPAGAAPGRPPDLIALVRRLLVAQAAMTVVLSLAFPGGVAWLALGMVMAAVLTGLASLARAGTHAAWVAAVTVEACCLAAGLARLVAARYLGGTLLAIITLGALAHPAVSRAFSARRGAPGETRLAEPAVPQNAGGS